MILDLPLQQAVATAHLGQICAPANQVIRQAAQHLEPPLDPEMVQVGDGKPIVTHAHWRRR